MTRCVQMELGEVRHVRIQVRNLNGKEFTISNAKYELQGQFEAGMESSGECMIQEHVIDAYISPKQKGDYYLTYTYNIGDETLVDVIKIRVV